MNRRLPILVLVIFLVPVVASAQYFDYRLEESPAVSWNGIRIYDARLMALGGVSLFSSKPFSAALNPALIPVSGKWIVGLSGNLLKYESFQYWGINEGVAVSGGEPFGERNLHIGGLALTGSFQKIRLSVGWYLSNSYSFPDFIYTDDWEYEQYGIFSGEFSGNEHTLYAAAAFKLSNSVDLGIKLDYITAERNVRLVNFYSEWFLISGTYIRKETQLEQSETHDLSWFRSTLGATFKISPRWIVGTALVYPFAGQVERSVTRSFENITDNLLITTTEDATDTLHRPANLSLSTRFSFPLKSGSLQKRQLLLAVESRYSFWSGYQYVFFDEEIPRNLKNTLDLALGLEYSMINSKGGLFFRLGFRLDPQPLIEPPTVLKVFSGGIGLRSGPVSADLALSYYLGQAGDIDQDHFLLSGTLGLKL